jgi:hypothetical protein
VIARVSSQSKWSDPHGTRVLLAQPHHLVVVSCPIVGKPLKKHVHDTSKVQHDHPMLLISRPPPPKRAPQAKAMSIQSSVSRSHVPVVQNSIGHPNQEHHHSHSPARRQQYIRPPALRIDCPPTLTPTPTPTPKHWDLASRVGNLDVREEDGYVLSANGEEFTSGVFVPCEPLSAVRLARRPGRLRIKPMPFHRRRISGITTSPISPTTVSAYFSLPLLLLTNH